MLRLASVFRTINILGVIVFLEAMTLAHAESVRVTAGSEAASLSSCVKPTDIMRREHAYFLIRKRDKTMYQGIRTKEHSLVECIACHVSKNERGSFTPINAEGQFCQSCHQEVAQKIDCFSCHRTTPDTH